MPGPDQLVCLWPSLHLSIFFAPWHFTFQSDAPVDPSLLSSNIFGSLYFMAQSLMGDILRIQTWVQILAQLMWY